MHDCSCVIAFQKFPFLSRKLSLSIQKPTAVVRITTFQILEIQNAYLFKRTERKIKMSLADPLYLLAYVATTCRLLGSSSSTVKMAVGGIKRSKDQ